MSRRRRTRSRNSRGSVMMLMPAAIVIMLLLGAIAVDSAVAFLAQRQAHNVATDAANDAAGAAVDLDRLRTDGIVVLDAMTAARVAADTVATSGVDGIELRSVRVEDSTTVVVTVRTTIDRVIGPAFGAGDATVTLTVRAQADTGRS